MPIYKYKCKKCGQDNEILTMAGEKGGPCCEKCGSEELEKQVSKPYVGKSRSGNHPACESGECQPGACEIGSCPGAGGCHGM